MRESRQGIKLNDYEGFWNVYPVEYKSGEPKQGEEDELQLCAQAMCLEEMLLTEVPEGSMFYGKNRRRHNVLFTEELRNQTASCYEEMHQLYKRGYTPKVKKSKKCNACSLNDICLPKLQKIQSVSQYIDEYMEGKWK